jgi:hypothetical protein
LPEAAAKTAGFYAPYAVFFATVSANLRVTPGEVLDYFMFFAGLPDLKVGPSSAVACFIFKSVGASHLIAEGRRRFSYWSREVEGSAKKRFARRL